MTEGDRAPTAEEIAEWETRYAKALRTRTCVSCHKSVKASSNPKWMREYKISGLCKLCQSSEFGGHKSARLPGSR